MPDLQDFLSAHPDAPVIGIAAVLGGVLWLGWRARWLRRRHKWIAVDGSNVLYWQDETPSMQTVREVVDALKRRGFRPVVWFDANVGYLVASRYLGPAPLSRSLGLSQKQVVVAPKGTPADPMVIEGARTLRARIVSNDRFRNWQDQFPEVREASSFMRGSITNGALRLDE